MKPRTNTLLLAAVMLALASCQSGNDQKTTSPDSTATAQAPAPAPMKDEMFVMHKVADFTKWKAVFDADSANRLSAGLHDHIVARGDDDPNKVLLIFYMDDTAKARSMARNPALAETMKKAGVTGPPQFDYIHRPYTDTAPTTATDRLMVKHRVKDVDAWKKIFDEDKPNRAKDGVMDRMIGYSMDDPHMITIVFVINDLAKAKAMLQSKEIADKMKAGGVEGKPVTFFYKVVEKKG